MVLPQALAIALPALTANALFLVTNSSSATDTALITEVSFTRKSALSKIAKKAGVTLEAAKKPAAKPATAKKTAAKKALHNETVELVARATEKVVGKTVDAKLDNAVIEESLKESR